MFKLLKLDRLGRLAVCLCVMLALCAVFAGFAPAAYASEGGDEPVMGVTMASDDENEAIDPDTPVSNENTGDTEKSEGSEGPVGEILTTGEETAESAEPEEEEEKARVRFVLFEKLADLNSREWLLFSAALAAATGITVYIVMRIRRNKERAVYGYVPPKREQYSTKVIVYGAFSVALSFALSYIKLFSMPTGGSVTLASMLPLCVYSNRFGFKYGVIACVVYGWLQLLQSMYILNVWQMLLEYPIAFGVISIGGLFRKLPVTVLVGCFLRFLCHFLASVIFWKEYLDPQYNMWIASLIYNGIYMGVDTAICLVIALIPQFNRALDTILPKRGAKEEAAA